MLIRFSFILILAVLIVSCDGITPSSIPEYSSDPSPILPNLLVEMSNQVAVRRRHSTKFVSIGVGAELWPGDTLRVIEGQASIFCGDEAEWDKSPKLLLVGKEYGIPCLFERPPRPAPDIAALRLRSGVIEQSSSIPYILTPRSGWVSDNTPVLRWHTVPGSSTYTITLISDDGIERPAVGHFLEQKKAIGELTYPDVWPPLQAGGADYQLCVEDSAKKSDCSRGFSLLDADQKTRLQQQLAHLRQRPLTEPALTLLLAELYLNYELRSEAIELLSSLPNGNHEVAIQRLMGETYLSMGLPIEAKEAFEQMLVLAQISEQTEDEAIAYFGLGLSYCSLANTMEARRRWEQARILYQSMDMMSKVNKTTSLLIKANEICTSVNDPQ